MKTFTVLVIVVCPLFSSCVSNQTITATPQQVTKQTSVAQLNERDFALLEYLLRKNASSRSKDWVYYLTSTPRNQWGETGNWQELPDAFHERIADLTIPYRKASEANLENRSVIDRKTGKLGYMHYISIRWISDTEAEVNEGNYSKPLHSGGSKIIYEKDGNDWKLKELGGIWMS